jgi:hypothetical protein
MWTRGRVGTTRISFHYSKSQILVFLEPYMRVVQYIFCRYGSRRLIVTAPTVIQGRVAKLDNLLTFERRLSLHRFIMYVYGFRTRRLYELLAGELLM